MTAQRRDRAINSVGVWLLSAVLLVWTLLPIYNIIRVSMQEKEEVLSTSVYPIAPSPHAFSVVFRQAFWLLETFWNQMGNSFYIGIVVALLTLAIGSLASFTISRMRIRSGWMLTNAALLTYVIPMSFLAIPFYRIMKSYGLADNPWSVIAVEVTFATPYAIFIFQQYGASIPRELDEAARIDGASPPQIFFRIYLPLMAPALVAVGTYALLLAWNEYLYAFLLLSSDQTITVPVTLGKFLNSDEAPWNYLMAASIVFALPPLVIYYIFRRYMSAGLTMGGVKG
jgi:multiple sugar transport system permease protein